MKKLINQLLIFCTLYYLYYFLTHTIIWKELFINTLNLWLYKVVLGIIPMFVLSNILLSLGFIKHSFCLINNFHLFESKKALTIFIISFLCGSPSTSVLITKALSNNEITQKQAQAILNSCSFVSFLFLKIILTKDLFFIMLLSQIFTSFIVYYFNIRQIKNYNYIEKDNNILNTINTLIDELPKLLLKILSIMIIINILILPFHQFSYFTNYLEITIGLNNLTNANINDYGLVFLLSTLISSNGMAILLQIYHIIKKTRLSFKSFILNRLVYIVINLFLSLLILLLMNFIF